MKTKLAHKVVIVITIPVIFQIGLSCSLLNSVRTLDDLQDRASAATKILVLRDQLYVSESNQLLHFGLYRATCNPEYKKKFHEGEQQSKAAFRELFLQWKDDPVKIHILKTAWTEHKLADRFGRFMVEGEKQPTASSLLGGPVAMQLITTTLALNDRGNLHLLFDQIEQSQAQLKLESQEKSAQLNQLLVYGLCASLLVSFGTGLIFSQSIAHRLKKVVDNIKAMENHEIAMVAVDGDDEIFALNNAIIDTDQKIRIAEEFQAQTARIVAQELQKPLDHLSTSLKTLRESGFEDINENGKERLDRSLLEVTRLRTLVRDLVSLDKISRAGWDLEIQKVDLAEIARVAVDTVQDFAHSVNVKIECRLLEVQVMGDPARLQQIALNLLTNAIKFSRTKTTIEIETKIEGAFGQLSVTDHGTGIPEEFQQSIFGKFEQVSRADSTEKGGSGLGLAISRKLVESQSGKMGFDSRLGEGSTFWLRLPFEKSSEAQPENRTLSGALSEPHSSNQKSITFKPAQWKAGLLLVVLPIFVQVATICVLWQVIGSVRNNVTEFDRASQITSYHAKIVNSLVRSTFYSVLYNVEPYPFYKIGLDKEHRVIQQLMSKLQEISQANEKLARNAGELSKLTGEHYELHKEIVEAEQDVKVDRWFGEQTHIETERKFKDLMDPIKDAMEHEAKLVDSNVWAKLDTRKSVESVLLVSLLCTFGASIALGIYMSNRTISRVDRIVENAMRLVERQPLNPPVLGTDELAYVDHSFFDAANRLVQLERFKQEIVAITSHEFRTPLTSLLAKTDLLEAGVFGSLNEIGEQNVAAAKRLINDLIVLITNLLDVEKMLSGKTIVAKSETSIDQILNDTMSNIDLLLDGNSVTVRSTVKDLTGSVDAVRLVQALTAVLTLIVEQAPSGTEIVLDSSQTHTDIHVLITVSEVDRVHQVLDTTSARGRLALDLLRLIVEQHSGALEIGTADSNVLVLVKLFYAV